MSGTASGWTPVGPAGGGRWELLVFCCIWLGLRARCAGIGTGKESGRMVFTDVDYIQQYFHIWLHVFCERRFDSNWLHCSKCRIPVLLRYYLLIVSNKQPTNMDVSGSCIKRNMETHFNECSEQAHWSSCTVFMSHTDMDRHRNTKTFFFR